jgi:hypothetical protein
VSVLLGRGDGTFDPAVNYAVGNFPLSVFSIDLDGDGHNDLVVGNISGGLSILLNIGDGTFHAAVTYTAGTSPRAVFSADLDGDGDNDLAVANYDSDNVSILLNDGHAIFGSAVNYPVGGNDSWPRSIFLIDLDGDDDYDLAVALSGKDQVAVLLNDGDGVFQLGGYYSVHGAGYALTDSPRSVFSADLDGDGDNDLVTANFSSHRIAVLLNNGSGAFPAAVTYLTQANPQYVFLADLDGDDDNDLAVANNMANQVGVMLNDGSGVFAVDAFHYVGGPPCYVSVADLDDDGDNDVVTANQLSNNVSVLLNLSGPYPVDDDGDGYTDDVDCDDSDPYTYPGAAPSDNGSACMRDFDGDGYGDESASGDVIPGTDCDDSDASINPGAIETTDDGIDQDCNGADMISCYVDADMDGYGSMIEEPVKAPDGSCDMVQNESDNMLDCDDAEASINPDAEEIPDDGIDQDCDGEDLVSTCCVGRVGDANGVGTDEPTIGDASAMINAKFIAGTCDGILVCLTEADINQTGGIDPSCDDITIGDISDLINYLFIGGPSVVVMPDCL